MCWHFNISEPTGQPVGPGPADPLNDPETARNRGSGFDATDLFTRGRCGSCPGVPPMWKLIVPYIGGPYELSYAGDVYLRRIPYEYQGVFTGYFESKCSWGQIPDEPIVGANKYRGPFDQGWFLTFEQGGATSWSWSIYTPAEYGDLSFDPTAQSRYIVQDRFSCLGQNSFARFDTIAAYPFPYLPPTVGLIPFYG